MRCYDCGGGPSNSCKQTVITCGEGERCGFLDRKPNPGQAKQRESFVVPAPTPTSHCFQQAPSSILRATTRPTSVWLWADGAPVRAV